MSEQTSLRTQVVEASRSDVGRVRDHNEDNFGMSQERGLYIVADGMGGHAAGEVASKMAVEALLEVFKEVRAHQATEGGMGGRDEVEEDTWTFEIPKAWVLDANPLVGAIKVANHRIFEKGAQSEDTQGMGTTIVALSFKEDAIDIAHVGDSRVYRLRKGKLEQMTRDHSWYAELQANAEHLDAEALAYAARYKNVITRALGMRDNVDVDLRQERVEEGDLYLLCSDGLHDMIEDEEIGQIIRGNLTDLPAACDELIGAANAAGGSDNVTVMLVHCLTVHPSEESMRLLDRETVTLPAITRQGGANGRAGMEDTLDEQA